VDHDAGIGVEIKPRNEVGTEGYRWPAKGEPLPDSLVEDLARYGPAALDFVADRRDLAAILAEPRDVVRGDLFVRNVGEGRYVNAVLLARMLGDAEVEQRASTGSGGSSSRMTNRRSPPGGYATGPSYTSRSAGLTCPICGPTGPEDLSDLRVCRP
jgi:hypothetical protein